MFSNYRILGKGHHSIVLESDNPDIITKIYNDKSEVEGEFNNLYFLSEISGKGFFIDCKIPKIYSQIENINVKLYNKTYTYKVDMEKINGNTMYYFISDGKEISIDIIKQLAKTFYLLHNKSHDFIKEWIDINGSNDDLLSHILNDKGNKVINEGDELSKKLALEAYNYLISKFENISEEQTLTHQDINLNNIMINESSVTGIVDWGSFGYSSLSLSFYQLLITPIWEIFRNEYENLGGKIQNDILYSAALINILRYPIIHKELNMPYDKKEYIKHKNEIYEQFKLSIK